MNAQLFEKAFYQKTDTEKVDTKAASAPAPAAKQGDVSEDDRQLLERLMSDESTAELLLALVKKLA